MLPIVTVPLLTPRLSSRWLALVTDVDIDDRAQPDRLDGHRGGRARPSIRDVVPGEPLTYEEAVPSRTGRPWAAAASGSPEEQRVAGNSIDSDHVMWVRIGARMPPLARRSRPQTVPSRTAAKASMTLPVASVATTYAIVVHDAPGSAGWRRTHRAAEEQLLGDAVDEGDRGEQRQRALVGVLQHRCRRSRPGGRSRETTRRVTRTKTPTSSRPSMIGARIGRMKTSPSPAMRPKRWSRPDRKAPAARTPGQHDGRAT